MSKPDKLPYIDPNVRGVFDVIIRTAADLRKQWRAADSMSHHEKAQAANERHQKARERERQERAAEVARMERQFIEAFTKPPRIAKEETASLETLAARLPGVPLDLLPPVE